MTPRPGDRSPGFFIEPSRCWAMVYDHNLQSTDRAEETHLLRTLALTQRGRPVVAGVELR